MINGIIMTMRNTIDAGPKNKRCSHKAGRLKVKNEKEILYTNPNVSGNKRKENRFKMEQNKEIQNQIMVDK